MPRPGLREQDREHSSDYSDIRPDAPEAFWYLLRSLSWFVLGVVLIVALALLFTLVFTHAPVLVPVVVGLATTTICGILAHENHDLYRLFYRIDQRVAEYAGFTEESNIQCLSITPVSDLSKNERTNLQVRLRKLQSLHVNGYSPRDFRAFLKLHTNAEKEDTYKEGTSLSSHLMILDGWWTNPGLHVSHQEWAKHLLRRGIIKDASDRSAATYVSASLLAAVPVLEAVGADDNSGFENRSNPTPTDECEQPHHAEGPVTPKAVRRGGRATPPPEQSAPDTPLSASTVSRLGMLAKGGTSDIQRQIFENPPVVPVKA